MLRRSTNFILLSILVDVGAIIVSVSLAYSARGMLPFGLIWSAANTAPFFAISAVVIYLVTFLAAGVYDPDKSFRVVDEMQALLLAGCFACLALAGFLYFAERGMSRVLVVYFYLVSFFLLVGWRLTLRVILRLTNHGNGASHHVILIGQGDQVLRATERLKELGWAGVEVLGCISDQPPASGRIDGLKVLGPLDEASEIIRGSHTEDVVIAMPQESYARVEAMVGKLLELPCNLWVAPDYFSLLLYGSQVENLGGVPMISLKVPTLSGYERVTKRLLDLAAGGLLTVLSLPLMGLIALAIRLDSHGPILFRQLRAGENGRVFGMLKFRTMVQDAERRLSEVVAKDSAGNLVFKRDDDPRITRTGRWLRHTSLDELPQLFNVLRGEMSLVGPRPEMPWLVEQYKPWQRKRFAVPQGMTGWWQVNGRSNKPMHLNTEDDLFYVRNYSILLDLRILFKTVLIVLRGRGAY